MTADKRTNDVRLGLTDLVFEVQHQGHDCVQVFQYHTAHADPGILEAYCYTSRISYAPGETVAIHASATEPRVQLTIARDGAAPRTVANFPAVAVPSVPTPPEFYSQGCDWPVVLRWKVPDDLAGGFYVLRIIARRNDRVVEHEHGFCVRRRKSAPPAPVLFILSTCTWTAYNDWGGINNYVGRSPPPGFSFAPRLSLHRPYARGLIWKPRGAPRIADDSTPALGDTPRYQSFEWAYAKGFSKWCAGAGWAAYERNFADWSERQGLPLDYITQHDLDADPTLLEGHRVAVMVGHCEYWSARMRDAIDAWVERGGNIARFAGNFGWQIRLEDGGTTQVCYKDLAREADPYMRGSESHLTTTLWEDPITRRPGSLTFGLQAIHGIYARVGAAAPRGSGGFTVYRPEHWAFADADLYYGDTFGSSARIFAFECDGLQYEFEDGLPYPKSSPSIPPGLEILAMNLVSPIETDHMHPATRLLLGDAPLRGFARIRYGDDSPEHLDAARRGAGMIVSFRKGQGEVFHAGSCEWVNGLRLREPFTEAITRTVVRRLAGLDDRAR